MSLLLTTYKTLSSILMVNSICRGNYWASSVCILI